MREWKFTCRNFMFVRKILKEYDFTDDESIPAILEYSNAVRDSLNALYSIAKTNIKGD